MVNRPDEAAPSLRRRRRLFRVEARVQRSACVRSGASCLIRGWSVRGQAPR